MEQGLIQIYAGDGKGKTTASIGLTVRAVGQGLNCCFVFFFKDLDSYVTGELPILKKLGVKIYNFVLRSPRFNPEVPFEEMKNDFTKALEYIVKNIFSDTSIDLLVLDEINHALKYGYITDQEMIHFMDQKPKGMELVLTGRGATEAVMKKADLVSRIEKIKHPYDLRIKGRKGIEY